MRNGQQERKTLRQSIIKRIRRKRDGENKDRESRDESRDGEV